MSRSKKKTPIMGMTSGGGQKRFKQDAHRSERAKVKILLSTEQYDSLPDPKTYGNEWDSPRDGKQYFGLSRTDPEWAEFFDEWMRK